MLPNSQTIEFQFVGRKPSKKQVKAKLIEMLQFKPRSATIHWGENWIEAMRIDSVSASYAGIGWIKDISGADLVAELSHNNYQTNNS